MFWVWTVSPPLSVYCASKIGKMFAASSCSPSTGMVIELPARSSVSWVPAAGWIVYWLSLENTISASRRRAATLACFACNSKCRY